MILPDLCLPSRAGQIWQYTGIDSPEHCEDQEHFVQYPHSVEYRYNSRGFRDQEWPQDPAELRSAVWCLGDSFTVGVGQPYEHTWPQILSARLNQRVINVSMDGASNHWILRRCRDIMQHISPTHMIVMWSYAHRRELPDLTLNDEQRRVPASYDGHEQDYVLWHSMVEALRSQSSNIVQATVPEFMPSRLRDTVRDPRHKCRALWVAIADQSWPACPDSLADLDQLPHAIIKELQDLHQCWHSLQQWLSDADRPRSLPTLPTDVIYIEKRLDWARDHHHFDILTAQWFVDQVLTRL